MWQSHLISQSLPVPVSRSLQVSLLASQRMESAAGGEPCGEPAISHDSHHVSLFQWTNLFASCHKGHRFKSPGGYLCETGILLLALSRYIFVYLYRSYLYNCMYMSALQNQSPVRRFIYCIIILWYVKQIYVFCSREGPLGNSICGRQAVSVIWRFSLFL